ncbi:response regulator, partial [Aeromonas hydrophila]|uniref:response regulator n=1 Tax=Aeromonas hydrophila TaxID=644 RepID=UPI0038D04A47
MRYHILVVEDDAVTREKLTGYFEREGYRVTAVENGQEMRAVLAEQTVDLVMLDINLPGEDGLLLTRELRARSTVGIILVTGRSDAVDKIVGLEMGADDYVTKPFELRELLVRVKNLLWRISLAVAAPSEPAVADDAVRFGPWRFDIPRRQLSKDGVP